MSGDGQLSNIFFFTVAAPGHGANPHLALPHFVFGGAWYSAIYLSNTTNALESVQLTFRDDTGAPLFVPLAGIGSLFSRIVILNPGTTVLLEALNVGDDPSTEGWVDISLPPGVMGYGVSRLVTAGHPDQEALIPFAPESSQTVEFTYDDTSIYDRSGVIESQRPTDYRHGHRVRRRRRSSWDHAIGPGPAYEVGKYPCCLCRNGRCFPQTRQSRRLGADWGGVSTRAAIRRGRVYATSRSTIDDRAGYDVCRNCLQVARPALPIMLLNGLGLLVRLRAESGKKSDVRSVKRARRNYLCPFSGPQLSWQLQ